MPTTGSSGNGSGSSSSGSSSGGGGGNFLWIIKSSLFFNTSRKLFASFAGHITSSASNYSLSGKPNRCDYTPLTPVEPNNNNNNNNGGGGGGKHATADSRRGQHKSSRTDNGNEDDYDDDQDAEDADDDDSSTDSSDEESSDDDDDDDDDDEESDSETDQLDRLTCIVCERAFSSTRILDRHKIRERHFGCGTCDAVFPTQMALEAHQEEADHWSSDDDGDYSDDGGDDDGDERYDFSDEKRRRRPFDYDHHDSPLDTEDEIELDRKDRQLQKDRLFLI